jgi:hypothetical protein
MSGGYHQNKSLKPTVGGSQVMETSAGEEDRLDDNLSLEEFTAITLAEIVALLTWQPKPGDWCPRVSPGIAAYFGRE